jgi:hypothetical protein
LLSDRWRHRWLLNSTHKDDIVMRITCTNITSCPSGFFLQAAKYVTNGWTENRVFGTLKTSGMKKSSEINPQSFSINIPLCRVHFVQRFLNFSHRGEEEVCTDGNYILIWNLLHAGKSISVCLVRFYSHFSVIPKFCIWN